jgi:hypothetical protein
MTKVRKSGLIAVFFLAGLSAAVGAVQTWYGPAEGPVSGWGNGTDSIAWTAMPSLNSPVNPALSTKGQLDFVGDSSNPGFYTAQDASYLFFRMRVDFGGTVTGTTFSGAHLLFIDVVGWNYPTNGVTDKPDFSIAWDSKSNDPVKHGMEMQIPPANLIQATTWGQVQMDDIDGSGGQKIAPPDIPFVSEPPESCPQRIQSQSSQHPDPSTEISTWLDRQCDGPQRDQRGRGRWV